MESIKEQLELIDIKILEEGLVNLDNDYNLYTETHEQLKCLSDEDVLTTYGKKLDDKQKSLQKINLQLQNLKTEKEKKLKSIEETELNHQELLKNYKTLSQHSSRLDLDIEENQKDCLDHYEAAIKPNNGDALLGLLENVTGVEWDMKNCSSDNITGFIVEENQVKKFSFENEEQSNKLWEQLTASDEFEKSLSNV